MSFAFVFPGQGSQSVGMLASLSGTDPVIQSTFDEASAVLGFDLWHLVQEGPVERLNSTEYTQPAMLAAGIATWRLWRELPVGTSLAWREQAGPGRRGEFSGSFRSYELGLFYTGSEHFTIGTDFFWQRVLVERSVLPELDAVQFRLVTRLEF